VNEEKGTAYGERLPDIDVAGKTGTAQVSHLRYKSGDETRIWYFNRDHAWFSCYAPSRAPEIAVVTLIEHGGAGGRHAAPVAFQVIREYERLKAERAEKAKGGTPKPPPTQAGGKSP
jgi:penicillin-binding protein 2